MNRILIEKLFRNEGWSTISVEDGREAVRAAGEHRVDLVVLDCQMPVMDGLEAARAIRSTERGRSLPIMALTAYALSDYKARCIEAGMDAFVSKPVRREVLFDEVERLMTGRENSYQALADLDGLLRKLQGDKESLAELVHLFLDDLPEQTRALFEALKREDRRDLRNAAHALKGSLSNLGAEKGAAAAESIMKLAAEAPFPKIDPLIQEFERVLDETAKQLREEIA
jgi:CheY-like chemotaxis protein